VEEAAAQERVRQLLLVVGGDEDQRPVAGLHRPARLVDVELHAVELAQQVVRDSMSALSISSTRTTDLLLALEGLPEHALHDVVPMSCTRASPSWESRRRETASYS